MNRLLRLALVMVMVLSVPLAVPSESVAQLRPTVTTTTTTTLPVGPVRYLPLNKKYDYWQTSGNTSVTLDMPAGFFGPGSDAQTYVIDCTGEPFGPGAGQGLPAIADTSIHRKKDPNPGSVGDSDTVAIKIHGLSLVSVNPITVTYFGGSSWDLWDVHVGLSDEAPQPWGSLTATKTYSGGGTFDSSLTVVPKFTFTRISGGGNLILDVGDPNSGVPASTIQASNTHYINNHPGFSGSFHPGYSQGPTPEQINYIEFSNNCAEHETEPCEDCPDDPDVEVEPVDPVEGEPHTIPILN
ncbi:MAG: hypothetical protein AAF604_05195 [Acidobacteriota bacterium]